MAYEKSFYSEIAGQYDEIRQQNEQDYRQRCENVYERLPEIKAVDEEIKSLGLKLFKLAVKNSPDIRAEVYRIRQEQKELLKTRSGLLRSGGFSEDELNMRYLCDKCKDTGIYNDTYCDCFRRRMVLKAYENSNLSVQTKNQSFASFDISLYSEIKDEAIDASPREQMARVYKTCYEYAKGGTETQNLLFWGPPGVGKTFLSTCVAKEFIKSGKTVIYDTAYRIFTLLEDYKFKYAAKNTDEMLYKIERLYDCDLLILDDLGAEFKTAYSNAAFFDILNTRLNSGRKTIISTNLTLRELSDRYSERTFSRLMGNYMALQFTGEDIRLLKSPNM